MGTNATVDAALRRVMDVGDDVRARAANLQQQVRGVAGDVADNADESLHRLRAVVEDRKDAWEEPSRRVQLGFFGAAQAVLSVLLAMPRMVVRALTIARQLTERAEEAKAIGDRYGQRARELAHRLEPSRRDRRRQRARTAGVVIASATVGFGLGMVAERLRRQRVEEAQSSVSLEMHAHDVAQLDARRGNPAHLTVAVATDPNGNTDTSPE